MAQRWKSSAHFLTIEDDPGQLGKVLGGEVAIHPVNLKGSVAVTGGLIHDWIGAVYIPGATVPEVLAILRNFDAHKKIYPEVSDSRTLSQNGDDVRGYWRLQRKGMVPVILDVEQEAHYQQIADGKWICRAYARNIREVDTGLFSRGRKYPAGEGHGYLWRLYAYWAIESYRKGSLAECRTISLSRDIPEGIAWAVAPYVEKTPEESLLSTLSNTRKSASR